MTCIFPDQGRSGRRRSRRPDDRLARDKRPRRSGCRERSISRDEAATAASPHGSPALSSLAISSRSPAISAPARPRSRGPYLRALDRRSRTRGAEPDLHADPDLRWPRLSDRARRLLSPARRRRTRRSSAGTRRSKARWRWSNGRSARRTRCRRIGSTSRFSSIRRERPISAAPSSRARRHGGAVRARARASSRLLHGAGWADAAPRAVARRRLDARLRAADRRRRPDARS